MLVLSAIAGSYVHGSIDTTRQRLAIAEVLLENGELPPQGFALPDLRERLVDLSDQLSALVTVSLIAALAASGVCFARRVARIGCSLIFAVALFILLARWVVVA